MNNKETAKLVGLIAQLWPSMKINEFTADAWHPALADLDLDDAITAVYTLIKTQSGYIGIADIRRTAAANAGLFALDEGDAYDMAAKVAAASGIGARMLPGAVQDAYWQMGGSQGFEDELPFVRARWNKVYAACCTKREAALLAADLGAAIRATRRPELAPATAQEPVDALTVNGA